MNNNIDTLWYVLVVLIWSCSIRECLPLKMTKIKLPANVTVPAVFVFGDSIVDTGNNNDKITEARCDYPPYGKDFQGGLPSGRFSNGKVPSDLIVESLGIKELLPPYLDKSLQLTDLLTGVNFAAGGVGFDPLTPKLATVESLLDQLQKFKEYIEKLKGMVGENRTNFIITNSLFFVVAGTNDIANTYFLSGIRKLHFDVPSYTDFMLTYASQFFKELYGLGARRIGILSLPPMGCCPSQRTLGGGLNRDCAEYENRAAVLFNTKLSAEINHLMHTLRDSRIVYIDIYYPLLNIIRNPYKYGFEVETKGCCGTGLIEVTQLCNHLQPLCPDDSKYVFWDSFHPTERTYMIIVQQIINRYTSQFY